MDNLEFDMGKSSLASGPLSHKFGRSLSKNVEETYLNILRAVFMFVVMLWVLLEIYAWFASRIIDSQCLRAIACISIMMVAVSLLGALGCYRTVQDINLTNIAVISGANSGQEVLLHAIYFMVPAFALYCLFGTAALWFTDEIIVYNKLAHQHEPFFQSESFDEKAFEASIDVYISTAGYISYVICLILLVSYHLLFYLTVEYEAIHTLQQIHNSVLLFLSMLLLSSSLYSIQFLFFFDLQTSLLRFAPLTAIGLTVLIATGSFVGLKTGHSENKNTLVCYIMTMMVFAILAALATVFLFIISYQFEEEIARACPSYLEQVSEGYLGNLGCKKYFRHINGQYLCDNPILITESEAIEPELGCVNSSCCEALVTHAMTTYDYMTIVCACIVVFSTLSLANAVFHYRKIIKFDRSYLHRYDGVMTLIMVGILVVGLGTAAFVYFEAANLN